MVISFLLLKAVCFKMYAKSNLVFLIYLIIYFFQEYCFFFCAVPFYDLFAALRMIYPRCPLHLFIIFLAFFKQPGDCCEN